MSFNTDSFNTVSVLVMNEVKKHFPDGTILNFEDIATPHIPAEPTTFKHVINYLIAFGYLTRIDGFYYLTEKGAKHDGDYLALN